MFYSGIADEAGKSIELQIKAHKELGWDYIEIRNVDDVQFTDVDDAKFDEICGKLADANLKVSCFASAIANWARPISGDFAVDVNDLKRAIPRMQKLGTKFIRMMSWPNRGEKLVGEEEWKAEVIRRSKELAKIAEDGGVTLVLENCVGWAAESAKNMVEYLTTIDSPAMRVVFDTGNAVPHGLHSLNFYTEVKPFISYIHVKDDYLDTEGECRYTWPNEGCGYVRQILTDVLRGGYDGGISIEPHLLAQVHLGTSVENDGGKAYNTYIEYGRRTVDIVEKIKVTIK